MDGLQGTDIWCLGKACVLSMVSQRNVLDSIERLIAGRDTRYQISADAWYN